MSRRDDAQRVAVSPEFSTRCSRCGRRLRKNAEDMATWNVTFRKGVMVNLICPACQTVDENAEAVINEATLAYERDAFGRAVGFPRLGGDEA